MQDIRQENNDVLMPSQYEPILPKQTTSHKELT